MQALCEAAHRRFGAVSGMDAAAGPAFFVTPSFFRICYNPWPGTQNR
jgi:hypothetical protein